MKNIIAEAANSPVSPSAQHLWAILSDLQEHSFVQTVALCTADGIPVHEQVAKTTQIAAVAGFLLSSAKQSSNMLGHKNCHEVTIEFSNGSILVCHTFLAGETELILALILKQKSAYRRLLMQTIGAIKEAVEE